MKILKIYGYFLLVFYSCPSVKALIDLEVMAQDFVIQAKRIVLADDYPHAFNPSLVRWQGKLLMSFRVVPNKVHPFNSWLGVVWLDDNFNQIGKPQRLYPNEKNKHTPSRAEDGRLLSVGKRLYLVYSDNTQTVVSKGGFRMHVAQVEWNGEKFFLKDVECISSFAGASSNRREKNWVPFEYGNQLLLAYSITPHLIFHSLRATGYCETFVYSEKKIKWQWGELRGGTPALLDGDQYLAFFHSSLPLRTVHSHGANVMHYVIGAYTFSAKPPFEITHVSSEPIIGKQFYTGAEYEHYWKPVRVVFPCGFIKDNQYIWLSYGRQDHELWVAKIDKKRLYQSLIKI